MCLSFGAAIVKSVDLGPNDLRDHDIEGIIESHNHTVYDLGNIYIKDVEETLKYSSHEKMKYFKEISIIILI